ncbi:MAG: response regulator [Gammaproteobacteria bacterium]|nr:response regulator [Gammaproteobacteria bacterium]
MSVNRKTQILVVDDSRTQIYALQKVLAEAGYDVLAENNGREGVLSARRNRPDLILMDIVMPGVNGFEATRSLRSYPETVDIPVIIISGSDQASDRVWGMRVGADAFMAKPLQRTLLLEKITACIGAGEVKNRDYQARQLAGLTDHE